MFTNMYSFEPQTPTFCVNLDLTWFIKMYIHVAVTADQNNSSSALGWTVYFYLLY